LSSKKSKVRALTSQEAKSYDPEVTITKLDNLIKKYNIDFDRLEKLIKKSKTSVRPFVRYTQISFSVYQEKNPSNRKYFIKKLIIYDC